MSEDRAKIGVIGMGVVGRAVARTWMDHAEVRCYDVDGVKATHDWEDMFYCEYLFLCLPTPEGPDGRPDLSAVESVCRRLCTDGYYVGLVVLKSTVSIGTTRWLSAKYGLRMVHSPEFLTEQNALVDAQTPSRNIIGVISYPWATVYDPVVVALKELHERRFPGVPCLMMTSDESEAVKLMANNFFAAKVAFFNEWRQWADLNKLDWERVRGGVLADGRIAHAHTAVPGPDGKYGFGGTCLPKDLANTVAAMREKGFDGPVLASVRDRNVSDRGGEG